MECVYVGGPWDGKCLPYAMAPKGHEVICAMEVVGGSMTIAKYLHRPDTSNPMVYDYQKDTVASKGHKPEFDMLQHVLES